MTRSNQSRHNFTLWVLTLSVSTSGLDPRKFSVWAEQKKSKNSFYKTGLGWHIKAQIFTCCLCRVLWIATQLHVTFVCIFWHRQGFHYNKSGHQSQKKLYICNLFRKLRKEKRRKRRKKRQKNQKRRRKGEKGDGDENAEGTDEHTSGADSLQG